MTLPAGPLCTSLSSIKKAPKWTLQGRAEDHNSAKRAASVPGPGTYGNPAYQNSGRYSRAPAALFGASQRDAELGMSFNVKPGVGTYNPNHWSSSTLPNCPRSVFPKSSRDDHQSVFASSRARTPGPGAYTHKPELSAVSAPLTSRGKDPSFSRPNTPGPGQYTTPRELGGPAWKMGSSSRPSIGETGSRKQSPGPGTYALTSSFTKAHPVISSPPHYSMVPRRPSLKKQNTPGPGAHGGAFTTFGY